MSFLLDIYFGEKLAEESVLKTNFFEVITQSTLFYFFLVFGSFYIFFILFFFIFPLFKKNPKVLYNRYLIIRDEMQTIDKLNEDRQISFEDYVFAQFNYAKEYEHIINILSNYPKYREKLKSYKIATTNNQTSIDDKDKPKVDMLYNILLPYSKFYNVNEIKTAIRDEGFNKSVANKVIFRLNSSGIKIGSETKLDSGRITNFLNKLFESKSKELNKIKDSSSININNVISEANKKPTRLDVIKSVTFKDKENLTNSNKNKGGLLAAIKELFTSKKKRHTVQEIDSIFSDIEKSINRSRKIYK